MKADKTTTFYRKAFKKIENHKNVNKYVKAIIINFGDSRGDIIVKNDNFGTRRKYADFTKGKQAAGLNPMQIVFSGVELSTILKDRYIGKDDKIHVFGEGEI